jgi:hypothetical protein
VRDTLLENILDYFTEKWSEKRSDGTGGEKKKYCYRGKINEDKEDYRKTKLQRMEFEVENEKRFNIRKLNQFPFIISLLHSNVKKFEHLKHHIYLNYEFMHAAASSGKVEYFDLAISFIISLATISMVNSCEGLIHKGVGGAGTWINAVTFFILFS